MKILITRLKEFAKKFSVYIIAASLHLVVILLITVGNQKDVRNIIKEIELANFKVEQPKDDQKKPETPVTKPKQVEEGLKDNSTDIVPDQPQVSDTPSDYTGGSSTGTSETVSDVPDYLPQSKLKEIAEFNSNEIKKRIVYPPLALKQEIEAVVILEVYVDPKGIVKEAKVLKDPGYGFAEAAIKAIVGTICTKPALSTDGVPVYAKIRYPIRFTITK